MPNSCGGRSLFVNAIFSRLPVDQIWRRLLPRAADLAIPSTQQVLVEAVVMVDMGQLRVMTTHLEYYFQPHREVQIEAIRRLHNKACAMPERRSLVEEQGGPLSFFLDQNKRHSVEISIYLLRHLSAERFLLSFLLIVQNASILF